MAAKFYKTWNHKLAEAWFHPDVTDYNDLRRMVFKSTRLSGETDDEGTPQKRNNAALKSRVESFVIGSCLHQVYPDNYLSTNLRGKKNNPKMPSLCKKHTTSSGTKKWVLKKSLASTRKAISEAEFLESLSYDKPDFGNYK